MDRIAQIHILLHDYAGHPYTAELARSLARRGMSVTYTYFDGDGGPKGRNARLVDDPDTFKSLAVGISRDYSKSNLFKRRRGDISYGKKVAKLIDQMKPTIVLSGNTPTEAQEFLCQASLRSGAKFIYWCQDFYSVAVRKILSKKIPFFGGLIGEYYEFLERRQMKRSDHVVHITDRFCALTDSWGVNKEKVSVIPNWGLIDQIPQTSRNNNWSLAHALTRRKRVLYSGTLAMKHNPKFLSEIAKQADSDVDVVVVGFGVGADRLRAEQSTIPNLTVLPLQSFSDFPDVLGCADVLVAVIEEDAGEFSVPSKVLSYLCAGRPIVFSAPKDNLAARMIEESGAGTVVDPNDLQGFVSSVLRFLNDPDAAALAGSRGRAYAEEHFDIERVTDRFEQVFHQVLSDRR